MDAVVDIETTLDHNTIHMAGVYLTGFGKSIPCYSIEELNSALSGVTRIIGHNVIGFDLPVLERVWGFKWNKEVRDTLTMGRLLDPTPTGGHSLKVWAQRAGQELKDDFDKDDFDKGLTQQMVDYCLQDCRATHSVFQHIERQLKLQSFSDTSVELEHAVAFAIFQQIRNGFAFDLDKAFNLYIEQTERMTEISDELQKIFPPIIEERYSEKTGKRLKDKVTVFNVGSRQQVADRLVDKGAVWFERTPTGKFVIDEGALEKNSHVPEAAIVLEYMTLQKRSAMVKSWCDNCRDGRVSGYVNSNGTITGRMTHNKPNLAQIPSGAEYRSLFVAPEGRVIVGADASGLELRCLAHYMQDEGYTNELINGDIHERTRQAAGLASRSAAKTFTYALLYGAGDKKLGSVLGGSAAAGRRARGNYLSAMPAYDRLVQKVKRLSGVGSLPGLDGRKVQVRSEHSSLNTLLQSCGAIVMKEALRLFTDRAKGKDYLLVATVHDEFQIEANPDQAEELGQMMVRAIKDAGINLKMRCPLDGEYKVGTSWADTH